MSSLNSLYESAAVSPFDSSDILFGSVWHARSHILSPLPIQWWYTNMFWLDRAIWKFSIYHQHSMLLRFDTMKMLQPIWNHWGIFYYCCGMNHRWDTMYQVLWNCRSQNEIIFFQLLAWSFLLSFVSTTKSIIHTPTFQFHLVDRNWPPSLSTLKVKQETCWNSLSMFFHSWIPMNVWWTAMILKLTDLSIR